VVQPGFKQPHDLIALLGVTADDLSISEHAAVIDGISTPEMIAKGTVPQIDLPFEQAVQNTCLAAAEAGLLRSAHDCSDGGLAVALAECCFSSLNRPVLGAHISLAGALSVIATLFSETPSRIIISFAASARAQIENIAQRENCPLTVIGEVGGDLLQIEVGGEVVVSARAAELESAWRGSLPKKLEAEVMAAGRE
jgi:phosphoribosylformylglycinamidine synthase